jgi:hypothetical protein
LATNWQKIGKKLAKSWQKMAKNGKNWQKMAKNGKNWQKMANNAKIGKNDQNWQKLAKIWQKLVGRGRQRHHKTPQLVNVFVKSSRTSIHLLVLSTYHNGPDESFRTATLLVLNQPTALHSRVARFVLVHDTETEENVPNEH